MKWLIFLVAISAQAEIAKTEWTLIKGTLTYHVSFPLKNIEGVSKNIKGKGRCEGEICDFLIASPVKSFDSGDANRDNHMLAVTKGGLNPMVTARIRLLKSSPLTSLNGSAEISFGGERHNYQVHIMGRVEGHSTIVNGTVPMKLSDFKIKRPSLLGVEIRDEVPVDFEVSWE